MKRIKRFASLLLAMVMVLSVSLTAFAAQTEPTAKGTGNFTITLKDSKAGHKFVAYQVFKGDLAVTKTPATDPDGKASETKVLSNIEWGDDVDKNTVIAAVRAASYKDADGKPVTPFSTLATDASAADVADMLNKTANDSAVAQAFADAVKKAIKGSGKANDEHTEGAYTISGLTAGYYLVEDTVVAEGLENPDAYSRYIMEVVGDVEAEVKSEIPTLEKNILMGEDEVDTNSAAIGDDVTYQLKSYVPDHTGYNYYYFIMNDTLSKGLDFNNDVKVTLYTTSKNEAGETVRGDALPEDKQPKAGVDYKVYTSKNVEIKDDTSAADARSFKIAFTDIMKYTPGLEVVATFSARINDQAEVGSTGNPNEANLTYSNNPNFDYNGTRDNGNPGLPATGSNPPFGETLDDFVITFLTELVITKTQNENGPLAGAQFTLTGISKQTVLSGGEQFVRDDENGTYYQLTNGTYTEQAPEKAHMEEQTEPEGGYVRGYVVAENGYDGDDKVVVDSVAYRAYRTGDSGKVYTLMADTTNEYMSITIKFKKVPVTGNAVTERLVTLTGTSGADGKVVFKGLGEGDFTIAETITPAGFNTCEDTTLTTKATIGGKDLANVEIASKDVTCTWTNSSDGTYIMTIDNKSGALLPSTGGIGTTIFYVVGGILVVAAGILLVTKKRMNAR